MHLVMATRRSALALAQSRAFAEALAKASPVSVSELQIVTSGDKTQDRSLQDIGGKGLFIKELEEALLDGRADFAVHSIKDVPALLAPMLTLACVPAREDPRDVLVSKSGARLAELPSGAVVGTSSLRRSVAVLTARPDLRVEPVRGNVDTRLRRVTEGPFDAVILALAGLKRLGIEERATEILEPSICLPAVGQGALGIECREGDDSTIAALVAVTDAEAWLCVAAERAVMAAVEGSCRTPIAAFAEREGETMRLRAMLAEPDGTRPRHGERRLAWPKGAADAERAGRDLGDELRRG
ncbi:MAG TPA: hydroxymethylbilane synthase [Polyangiaceae bacterium]|nr:hydroxymethylbilane synthase [Polyangiaceae bacterium]